MSRAANALLAHTGMHQTHTCWHAASAVLAPTPLWQEQQSACRAAYAAA
jgi:hypothetical protein